MLDLKLQKRLIDPKKWGISIFGQDVIIRKVGAGGVLMGALECG